MSSFRRAPNVSQYIANLNSVSPADSSPPSFLNDDLELFTTTDFIDFDMGESMTALPISSANLAGPMSIPQPVGQTNLAFEPTQSGQGWTADFNFQTDFSTFQSPILDNSTFVLPQQPPVVDAQPSTTTAAAVATGEKRKHSDVSITALPDNLSEPMGEVARVAAEEDKRRRNTAASARFRIKKKQREAELETRAKEMTEKAAMLETKVSQLEMENRWLKSLITERDAGALKGEGEASLDSMWRKFESENASASSTDASKDGVGTAAKKQKVEA